jgi:O-antigen/teichoic acid export membrane protein
MAKSEEGLQAARQLTFMLMIAFLSLAFLVSIWLQQIFQVLIQNKDLASAYDVGIIIFMGYCYRPMYWCTINKLSTFNKTNVLWRISFMAGLLNLVLNLIFVGNYGIYAAAIITFVSLMFIGFTGFYLKTYQSIRGLNHYPLHWLCLIIAFTILAYFLRDVPVWLKLIISFVVLAFIYQLCQKLLKKSTSAIFSK